MKHENTHLKTTLQTNSLNQLILEEIMQVLSDKERYIIESRYSLNKITYKKTLDQIGKEYGITRERVRQIEVIALSKLTRIAKNSSIAQLLDIITDIMITHGSIMPESKLISIIIAETTGIFIDNQNLIRLALYLNPNIAPIKKSKYIYKSWYVNKKIKFNTVTKTIQLAISILKKKNKIITSNDFLAKLNTELTTYNLSVPKNVIIATLETSNLIKHIEEGYGLITWREVKPRSIKDKALMILKKIKKPLHFRELAKQIAQAAFDDKKVTIHAVHNELIRYDDFVLIGRGIYALRTWGYTEGTVKDIIREILMDAGPLSKRIIIEEVLKRRHVKIGTISLNLQKYPQFKRVGRAVYQLVDKAK